MGEKETNAGLGQAPAMTDQPYVPLMDDASLRPGGPTPVVDTSPPQSAIDPSAGPNQDVPIIKSKSNITNN